MDRLRAGLHVKNRCWDGILTTGTGPAGPSTSIDSGLPLGLLHLAAALQGSDSALPAYYPNLSYFDAKIVVAHRSR